MAFVLMHSQDADSSAMETDDIVSGNFFKLIPNHICDRYSSSIDPCMFFIWCEIFF